MLFGFPRKNNVNNQFSNFYEANIYINNKILYILIFEFHWDRYRNPKDF